MSEEWRLAASCRGEDLSVFFPTGGDTYAQAEVVCGTCARLGVTSSTVWRWLSQSRQDGAVA